MKCVIVCFTDVDTLVVDRDVSTAYCWGPFLEAFWVSQFPLSLKPFRGPVYRCYCAFVLRISRYSDFLSVMLTNTEIFVRCLKLCRESRF